MRPIEQNLTVHGVDANGITVSDTDVTGPFPLDLPIDGALSSTLPWNGDSVVDLNGNGFYPTITFTTGVTGSVADVTITGRDQAGNPQTEVVTMPGASLTVTSTKYWSYIESMSIDGAYTNLEVGIIASTSQVGPWVVLDHHQNGMELLLDLEEIVDGSTVDVELTTDGKFLRSTSAEPDTVFVADSPFAAAVASQNQVLTQTPAVAARIKHTTGSAGQWRARWLQSGTGNS
jgi:hypothetical protein